MLDIPCFILLSAGFCIVDVIPFPGRVKAIEASQHPTVETRSKVFTEHNKGCSSALITKTKVDVDKHEKGGL